MKKFSYTLLAFAIASASIADDFDDAFSDDVFADDPFDDIVVEESATNSAFSVTHEISAQTIANLNSEKSNAVETLYSGVTSVQVGYRPGLTFTPTDNITVNADIALTADTIFWLREDDDWRDEDIDARQTNIDIKDLTAQVRLNQWQLSSGIQTVTLGLADALSPSNILYAQDLSVPGTTDIDDTIKPAWTSMVAGSFGPVRIKAGAVHTHELNVIPPTGTDFDAGLEAMLAARDLSLESEALALENMGAFVSLSGVAGPLDWQVNGISQLPHSPTVEVGVLSMGPPPVIAPIALHYERQNTAALAASFVTGSFLWKGELAITTGLEAQTANGMMPGDLTSYERVVGTAGFDFDHSTLGRLVAEIQFGQILDYDSLNLLESGMEPTETSAQWALLYSKRFLREQLNITAQLIGFDIDASGGRIQGISAEYDVTDQLMGQVRYIDYVDGDFQFLQGADDRDRLLAGVSYSF
jgi:hypothetical protein